MQHIRPYRIFTLLQGPASERIANVQIPPRRAAGGVTLLETFLIVAALRIVAAQRVFEFGTYFGSTTLNLALNIPDGGNVFTLDLEEEHALAARQHPADVELTRAHLASRNKLDFSGTAVSSKITRLSGDSTKFDFTPWTDSIDLAFIDGGHDPATAKSDTENALRMVRKDRPACVVWHDYQNPEYPDLTAYLDELSVQLDLFHVEDTMLSAWLNESADSVRRSASSKV